MSDAVLALNAGSSSLKFALFTAKDPPERLLSGQVEGIGTTPRLRLAGGDAPPLPAALATHQALIGFILAEIVGRDGRRPVAVGHRVVHGGARFTAPALIDRATRAGIAALARLAPAHQPHALAGIDAVAARLTDVPQVAAFDTAFHHTLPEEARLFAIPYALAERGIRRYGFHGLSFEAVSDRLARLAPDIAKGRVVIAHLGNGASLCGLVAGESRHTTMGFTPLDGLVMGRRPGRLDAGVLLHLMREDGLDAEALDRLLNRESGLLGLSGLSPDMRDLLASEEPGAKRAVGVFVRRLVEEIGAAAAAIGGLDALAFTGGIGENAASVRAAVAERLAFLGVSLDAARNTADAFEIGVKGAHPRLFVVATDEEAVIARQTLSLVAPLA